MNAWTIVSVVIAAVLVHSWKTHYAHINQNYLEYRYQRIMIKLSHLEYAIYEINPLQERKVADAFLAIEHQRSVLVKVMSILGDASLREARMNCSELSLLEIEADKLWELYEQTKCDQKLQLSLGASQKSHR